MAENTHKHVSIEEEKGYTSEQNCLPLQNWVFSESFENQIPRIQGALFFLLLTFRDVPICLPKIVC